MQKQETLDWIRDVDTRAEDILPHNLPRAHFEILSGELQAIKADPNVDNVAECFVAIILKINGYLGAESIEHTAIVKQLDSYIKIFSVELLKRKGVVKSYELPNIRNILDGDREIDITFETI